MFAGIIYVYYHFDFGAGGDIILYFNDGQIIFNELKNSPLNYLQLTFGQNNIGFPENIKSSILAMGHWEDTAAYMVVRFNAIISLFSFGNYYVHGVFSGFISFVGCSLIVHTFKHNLNAKKLTLVSIFLFPPILYFTSGPHKELISVFGIGLMLYAFFELLSSKSKSINIIFFLIGFGTIFFVREHIAVIFIPILFAFAIVKRTETNAYLIYALVLLAFTLTATYIPPLFYKSNLVEIIVSKKILFESLKNGNTPLSLNNFDNFYSLIKNLPHAFVNTTLRPFFWEVANIKLLFISIESFIIFLFFLAGIMNLNKLEKQHQNFVLLMYSFSFCYLIITGLIVPNFGAIMRYRSVALVLLIPISFFLIEKSTFFNIFISKIKNMLKIFKKF